MAKSKKKEAALVSEQQIDEEVARYRRAISNNTLCERCLAANPPKSRFCMDCGRPL